jgi:hypothetical protein
LLERVERPRVPLDRELELRELPPLERELPPLERELPPLERELLLREVLDVVDLRARVAAPFFAAVLRLAASRLRVPAAFFAAAERDALGPPRARSSS